MAKTAQLYRMASDKHLCPYGLKSLHLLKSKGFEVEDHLLTSSDATQAFKDQHKVKTTPQTFIEGERIGGYEDLRRHLGLNVKDPSKLTYTPVLAIFVMAFLMSLALNWAAFATFKPGMVGEWFFASAMCLLALQKLRDVESFATQFLTYDLLAQRYVPYGYIYPFAEGLAGLLMLSGAFIWLGAPIALIIGSIGAASVFKAVYLDKRELKCACVGGKSNVPLGFVSLTENLVMIGMGVWMLIK